MSVSGGANLLDFFSLAEDHTAVGTTSLFSFTDTISSAIAKSDNGGSDITLDQIDDSPELTSFLDTYAPVSQTGAQEEVTLENGTKRGGATGESPDILAILYGAINTTAGKRKMLSVVCKVANTSGSWTQQAETYNRPTFSALAQQALVDIGIPATHFDATLVTQALQTIPALSRGFTHWMTAS